MISVIIVNYRVKHYIAQVLHSLYRTMEQIEVFVVDNNSGDNSIEYLSQLYPQVHYIANSENIGFGRANNLALSYAKGEYVLFLNPDTIISETTLTECRIAAEENDKIGAIGVRMQYSDGHFALESRRALPTPFVSFCKMSGLSSLLPRSRTFARYHLTYLDKEMPTYINIVSGAFLFVKRSILERVGGFDETFFMYGEDIDLSYRIEKAGYRNYYLPTPILHYKGESTTKTSYQYAKVFYDAMVIFYNKHFSHYNTLLTHSIRGYIAIHRLYTFVRNNIISLCRLGTIRESSGRFLYIGSSDQLHTIHSTLTRHYHQTIDIDHIDISDEELQTTTSNKIVEPYSLIIVDVSKFRYRTILDLLRSQRGYTASLATYHKDLRLIITELYTLHTDE